MTLDRAPDYDATNTAPGAGAASKLVIEGVSKWFRTPRATVHALDNVSMPVAAGEVVCIVGPSGCGKSTLLDTIAGLTKPDAGRVLADGQPVTGPGRQRLVVFQEPSLFPWLDVFGNVMFGLKLCPELSHGERREIAHRYLALVGLEKFERAHVHELSGGMKQRVAPYYASYLLVGLMAFVILWHSGDIGTAWLPLATAFLVVLLALASVAYLLIRRQAGIIPRIALGWGPVAKLATFLSCARTDMLRDGRLILEAFVLQIGIFLLDGATLWIAARSIAITIDPISAFLSFVLASVVATLSPIPLGLGTFEGTCTALLHIMGSNIEGSLAATLILRGFTLWLPMMPGCG